MESVKTLRLVISKGKYFYLSKQDKKIPLYSLDDLAAKVGCAPLFIRKLVADGEIPAPALAGRAWVFTAKQARTVGRLYQAHMRCKVLKGDRRYKARVTHAATVAQTHLRWEHVKFTKGGMNEKG